MLTVGILLCYVLGLSFLLLFSRKYTLFELTGYSFLIGMGVETLFLFLLDVIGVPYSQGVLIGLNMAAILAICGANYKSLILLKDEVKLPDWSLKNVNLVAVFLFCIIGYLFYAITVKNLFWPATEHDTIGSFDKLGRIMAIEGKLKISLFDYHLEGAGGIYPPLFHSSLAYVYIFGGITAKVVTTLFFLSLLTTFYSLVKGYVGSTAASFFTLVLMVTPELFSHAALGLGNLPTTAYLGAAAIATITWIEKRDTKYFWLGAVLMAFVIWIRSDTIVFIGAALLIVSLNALKTKDWKHLLVYSAIAVAPFIVWNLYLKLKIHAAQEERFDFGIGYNSERFNLLWDYISAFLFAGQHGAIDGGQLYGLVFILFFLFLLINAARVFKVGVKQVVSDNLYILTFFFVSFVLYASVFYFINEKTQHAPISSLMESSFKRGLFCFVPLALFYVATNPVSAFLFAKLEKFRTGS
jgi:hypothetical protein